MDKDLSGGLEAFQTVGYVIHCYEAGEYWNSRPIEGVHCPVCFVVHDFEKVSDRFEVRVAHDTIMTRDNFTMVVSKRFREFCARNGYDDIEFHLVDQNKELYELRPTRILRVDLEKSQPDFWSICLRCGKFDAVLIGRGVFFKYVDQPLPDGFYRTDFHWGQGCARRPKIIVGPETKQKLKREGFKRIAYEPVPYVVPRGKPAVKTAEDEAAEPEREPPFYYYRDWKERLQYLRKYFRW